MNLYLPIAGIDENLLILLSLGFMSGILSGLLGIGGGIVTTPALILLGISPTVAVATSANQMIGTSVAGVYTHYRYRSIDLKLGWVIISGSLFGGITGAYLIHIFHLAGKADLVISFLYIFFFGMIGLYMLMDITNSFKPKSKGFFQKPLQDFLFNLPFKMTFERTELSVSAIPLIGSGFIAGLMASLMGVGGGFLIVPILVYLLRLPMLLVTGTSLLQISFTSVFVTLLQSMLNHNVDLILASILLLGSSAGVILGIKIAKRQKESILKLLLSIAILIIPGTMIYHLWGSGGMSLPHSAIDFIEKSQSETWLAFLSFSHPLQYGLLSVLTAVILGLILAMFFKEGESLWNR